MLPRGTCSAQELLGPPDGRRAGPCADVLPHTMTVPRRSPPDRWPATRLQTGAPCADQDGDEGVSAMTRPTGRPARTTLARRSTLPERTDVPGRVLHVTQPVTGGVAQCVADLVARAAGRGVGRRRGLPAGRRPARRSSACAPSRGRRPATPGPSVLAETLRAAVARGVRAARRRAPAQQQGRARRPPRPARQRPDRLPAARLVLPGGRRAGPRRATLRWERLGARWADRVLCVSEAERRCGRERRSCAAGSSSPSTAST